MNGDVKFIPRTDLTMLFKSCIKTIKAQNKAIGVVCPPSKIFPQNPSTQFFIRAKDILENIMSHEKLLCDHRRKYLVDTSNTNSFSDTDRAVMDKAVSKNLKIIEDNIRTLETDLREEPTIIFTKNAKECYSCVINILRSKYLKTSANFRDMKDARLKKQKEKEKLFILQRPGGSKRQFEKLKSISRNKLVHDKIENSGGNFPKNNDEENINSAAHKQDEEEVAVNASTVTSFLDAEVEGVMNHIDEEERQMLEEENLHLHQELLSNHEEVKQITRQVVELSRMQDVLTENVEIQAQQIEDIQENILMTTDNIQRGNEQVREAMRKDAGFRVWIMFFLIVMSCSLLFLDWYNP